jgi:hypothetical protein
MSRRASAPEANSAAPPAADCYVQNLCDLKAKVTQCQIQEASIKREYKEAKEATAVAIATLLGAIDQEEKTKMPLFDGARNGQPSDDGWRQVLIREALQGFSDGFYDRLWEQTDIRTMGDYADWIEANQGKAGGGLHPLTMLNGIGPATIDKIQAAEEAFWERVRQQALGTDEEE